MASRLKEKYQQEVVPALRKEFNYKNPMQVPGVHKVVVNIGLGEVIQNAKAMDAAISDLAAITGQRPVITRARRSVAAFKLREGMQIGCMVTLRGVQMYEFLDRFVTTGFWPAILVRSLTAWSMTFLSATASLTPMLSVILVRRGASMAEV